DPAQVCARNLGHKADMGAAPGLLCSEVSLLCLRAQTPDAPKEVDFVRRHGPDGILARDRCCASGRHVARQPLARALAVGAERRDQAGPLYAVLRPGGVNVEYGLA